MKSLKTLSLVVLVTSATVSAAKTPAKASSKTPQGLYALQATNIDGETVSLAQYSGKVALVVNTASQCGFTPQYQGLESVFQKYKDKGFVVLGFPSNDFMSQEPGSNEEIQSFCKSRFGVTFPLFQKAPVTGKEIQPLYRFLTQDSPKEFQGSVGWNFVKFLVDRRGQVVGRFSSMQKPNSESLMAAVEKALKSK